MLATYLQLWQRAVTLPSMKASLFVNTAFLFLICGFLFLHAQTNATTTPQQPNPQVAREMQMLSFLTPDEQEKYAKARAKALADNPDLKKDGEVLAQQGVSLLSGSWQSSAADRQAFMEKMNSHRQKLRAAMLKEDATLPPIFAEIDKHISEMKAKQLGSMQSSSSPTNAPAAGPAGQ